jgi:hypothetical protein
MAPAAEASSIEIQSQEETVEGGLVFTCTEEDDYGEEEGSDMIGESNVGNSSSDHSSPQTNSSLEKLSGGDKRSLVNYPESDDEGEEQDQGQGQSPMDVDIAATPVGSGDGKRNDTMLFLKTKRIERHSTRIDSTPLKKMRTGQTESSDR